MRPGPPCTVTIEGAPAARVGDYVTCTGVLSVGLAHPPQAGPPPAAPPCATILAGSATVMICNSPAPRWVMDSADCGVFLGDEKMIASRKVLIG